MYVQDCTTDYTLQVMIIALFSSLEHARALEGVAILPQQCFLQLELLSAFQYSVLLSGAYAFAKLKPRLTFSRSSVC